MRSFSVLIVALAFCLAGCGNTGGSESFDGTLNDHPDALTDQGGDNFLTLAHNGGDNLPVSRLSVTVQPPGEDRFQVNHELSDDADGDGDFSEGDTLLVKEPGANLLGSADEGTAISVEVSVEDADDPTFVDRVFSGEWTP